jgi:hypothetical protein
MEEEDNVKAFRAMCELSRLEIIIFLLCIYLVVDKLLYCFFKHSWGVSNRHYKLRYDGTTAAKKHFFR